jgi:hypothetical protein
VARLSSFVIGSIPSWLDMASNYTIFGWFFIFICYDNSQAIYLFLLISKKVYSNKNTKIKEQLKLNVSICLLDWVVVILTIIVTFTDVDYWKVLQQITMACIGGHVYLLVKVYQGMVKVFDTSSAMGPALDPRVGAASVSSGVDDG